MVSSSQLAEATRRLEAAMARGELENVQYFHDVLRRYVSSGNGSSATYEMNGYGYGLRLQSPMSDPEVAEARSLVRIAAMFIRISSNAGGECQEADPFAPMRVIRTSDGKLVWRCDHSPEHTSPASA